MKLYYLSKKRGGGGAIFQGSKSNLARRYLHQVVKKKIKWNRITYSHASWIPNLINPHPHWYLMCPADFQWSYITYKKKGVGGAINLAWHYLSWVVKKKIKWNRITYSHASWILNLVNPHPHRYLILSQRSKWGMGDWVKCNGDLFCRMDGADSFWEWLNFDGTKMSLIV